MANEIATKIAQHKANRPVGLTSKERVGSRESIRVKSSRHEDRAIATLAKLAAGGPKVPATAQAVAARELLDRIGGKPKLVDEKQTEQSELDKKTPSDLLQYITEQIAPLPLPARNIIAECAIKGVAFDALDIMDELAQDLPPPQREPKPKREPRR